MLKWSSKGLGLTVNNKKTNVLKVSAAFIYFVLRRLNKLQTVKETMRNFHCAQLFPFLKAKVFSSRHWGGNFWYVYVDLRSKVFYFPS